MTNTENRNPFIPRVYLGTSNTGLIEKFLGFVNREFKTTSIYLDDKNSITLANNDIHTVQHAYESEVILAIKTSRADGDTRMKVYNKDTKESTLVEIKSVIETLKAIGLVEVENPNKLTAADKLNAINSNRE